MPADVPVEFERDTGGTESEWVSRLGGACGAFPVQIEGQRAVVRIGAGSLTLSWTVLPPRQIALMRFARLAVRFRFEGLDAAARAGFMRYFDLYMHRGGG